MTDFVFKKYQYDSTTKVATFIYQAGTGQQFTENVTFNQAGNDYNKAVLDRALFLAFILIGTSYYKAFPSYNVQLETGALDDWQATFFDTVYQEGMSQFAFENHLTRNDLAHFKPGGEVLPLSDYQTTDSKPLVLQSGGKDSLLLATILSEKSIEFDAWFLQNSYSHPAVLEKVNPSLITPTRTIDTDGLNAAKQAGALNGHVPITYIVFSIALVQAILTGKNTVLAAIGHEGEEPYGYIGDMPVAHQWAKTWAAEQQFTDYVHKYISQAFRIGSSLRRYSELKVAELFVKKCWGTYSHEFSSCNIGNYKLGHDNKTLGWCGNCPKCANSFLLFAPFVEAGQLIEVFNGENLFQKPTLTKTFKGLLGIDDVPRPFECIGEEAELRKAYHLAQQKTPEYKLPFEVPESDFDYQKEYPAQAWAADYS